MNPADRNRTASVDRPGWLDAATSVLRRLLRSPRFKGDLRSVLNQIDPVSAPDLVRVALWTDPSVSMSFLNALPRAANALILGLAEIAAQSERFPAPLLANFLRDTLSRIRLAALGKASGRMTALSLQLAVAQQDWPALAREYMRGFSSGITLDQLAEGLVGAAGVMDRIAGDNLEWIDALASAVGRVISEHPRLVDRVLVPLLGPVLEAVQRRRHR